MTTRRYAGPRGRLHPRFPADPRLPPDALGAYAAHHFERKVAAREGSPRWLASVRRHLEEAVRVLGPATPLAALGLPEVEGYLVHLLERPGAGGRPLAPATVNHYLNSLSNLFRRAVADGLAPRNPVGLLLARPGARPGPCRWLEPPEVSALLAFARTYAPARPGLGGPVLLPLLSAFAYTGVRKEEGLGLEVRDVDFGRGVVHVRPNPWRPLKNAHAERALPLFTELAVTLRGYLDGPARPTGRLLFPSPGSDPEAPLQNLRRVLDRMPLPVRFGPGPPGPDDPPRPPVRLRLGMLRHSYCAARLQTLDWGAPIAPFTVARELGHTDLRMVLRIYGHLGRIRPRSAEVSFLGGTGPAGEGTGEPPR